MTELLFEAVVPPDEDIGGRSQQKLADRWWGQTLSTPDNVNPFITDDSRDPRGRRGSIERHENFQSESPDGVSFLGGILSRAIKPPAVRTIVAEDEIVYFAPFANQLVDNTTEDSSPDSEFPGGYALTPKHLDDLSDQDPPLNPRDPSIFLKEVLGFDVEPGETPTLLDAARFVIDNLVTEQFVLIDGEDVTPSNIEDFRQETQKKLSYDKLPRHTGVRSGDPEKTFLADPDLGENLDNKDPSDDKFPTLAEIKNSSSEEFVVPFVQAGDYFGFELDSGAHTVQFGADFGPQQVPGQPNQDVTYNILNPIIGTDEKDTLTGTPKSDYIDGGNGKDFLLGKARDDLILGGNGRDTIDGGIGDDELWGDNDKDTFIYKKGYGEDTIFDFQVGEVVEIAGFESFEILDIFLDSGLNAAEIKFNNDDDTTLTFVGVQSNDLFVDLDNKTITFV